MWEVTMIQLTVYPVYAEKFIFVICKIYFQIHIMRFKCSLQRFFMILIFKQRTYCFMMHFHAILLTLYCTVDTYKILTQISFSLMI